MVKMHSSPKEEGSHHKHTSPPHISHQHRKSPTQANRNLTKKKAGDIRVNGQIGQLLINNIKKVTMASTMILMIGKVVGHIL